MHLTPGQNAEKEILPSIIGLSLSLTDSSETWGHIKLQQGKIFSSAKYEDVLRNVYPISDWPMKCIPILGVTLLLFVFECR